MPWTCCSGRSSSPASLRINGTPIPPSYIQAFPLEAENWKSATSGPPQSKGRRYSIRTEKQKSLTRVDTRKALVDKANCQGQSLSCRLDWGLALLTSGKRDERNRSHTKNEGEPNGVMALPLQCATPSLIIQGHRSINLNSSSWPTITQLQHIKSLMWSVS
jgi:hypothetical protein